jgi:tetratricopeptide (TPR) repeat protein
VAKPPELRLARVRILAAIGQIQAEACRGEPGLESLRQSLHLQQELVAEQPADLERRAELAGIQLSLGKTLDDLGRADSAIAPLETARELYEALGHVARAKTRFRAERGVTFTALGRAYSNANRRADSAAAWARAQAELTLAIEEKPEDPQCWIDRGLFFIRRRQESRAAADLWRAWSLDPGANNWSRPVLWAALVLFSGEREEYRRGCRRLLERFGQTSAPLLPVVPGHHPGVGPGRGRRLEPRRPDHPGGCP